MGARGRVGHVAGEPPHAELHPMNALLAIPKSDPPELTGDKWSAGFKEFVSHCLKAGCCTCRVPRAPPRIPRIPRTPTLCAVGHVRTPSVTCAQMDAKLRPSAKELLKQREETPPPAAIGGAGVEEALARCAKAAAEGARCKPTTATDAATAPADR